MVCTACFPLVQMAGSVRCAGRGRYSETCDINLVRKRCCSRCERSLSRKVTRCYVTRIRLRKPTCKLGWLRQKNNVGSVVLF